MFLRIDPDRTPVVEVTKPRVYFFNLFPRSSPLNSVVLVSCSVCLFVTPVKSLTFYILRCPLEINSEKHRSWPEKLMSPRTAQGSPVAGRRPVRRDWTGSGRVRWPFVFNVHYFCHFLKKKQEARGNTTVDVFRIWKGRQITGVYCTIRIIFYYILIICCFLLQVSFLLPLLILYGWEGTSRGLSL